jgi:hypothetical protein
VAFPCHWQYAIYFLLDCSISRNVNIFGVKWNVFQKRVHNTDSQSFAIIILGVINLFGSELSSGVSEDNSELAAVRTLNITIS